MYPYMNTPQIERTAGRGKVTRVIKGFAGSSRDINLHLNLSKGRKAL